MKTSLSTLALCAVLAGMPAAADTSLPKLELDGLPAPVVEALGDARDELEQVLAGEAGPQARAEAYGDYAAVALAHDLTEQARLAWQRAIELRPDRAEWHYLLGIAEAGDGRIEPALEALGQALELYPDDPAALIRRGRLFLETGDLDRAGQDFSRALALDRGLAAAYSGLGQIAVRQERWADAVDHFERALELQPSANRLHRLLGNALRGLGERERARAQIAQAGEVETSVPDPVLDQVLRQSRSPQFYYETALSRADAGRLEEAAALLSRARSLDPDNASMVQDHGELLGRLGRYQAARAAFEKLIELRPDSVDGHFYLGQLEEVAGRPQAAVEAYEAVLARQPGHRAAREGIAHARLALGDSGAAGEAFAALADEAGAMQTAARFRYWQGMAALRGGDCPAAAQRLDQAQAMTDGLDPATALALARVHATCAPVGSSELERLLGIVREVYQARPGLETAATLAMVHAALGRFDDALDYQRQAIFEALKSGTAEAYPDLGKNLERYQQDKPAERPYAPSDPVFSGGIERAPAGRGDS
jgi:tetratricopeptide (TPR) repeat protein